MSLSLEDQIERDVRIINRQIRALDRELLGMEREKTKLTYKIKTHANKGNVDMVNALSTEYLVYKINMKKLTKLKGQMSNVKQKIQIMRSVHDINKAIASLTNTMKVMNERMGISTISKMVMEYDIETTKMETNMEMYDDALDDEIDEDERMEIVNSVLDEIGIEIASTIKTAPTTPVNSHVEEILKSRLQNLLI